MHILTSKFYIFEGISWTIKVIDCVVYKFVLFQETLVIHDMYVSVPYVT